MNIEQFKNELESINIIISQDQLAQLERYFELIVEWNQKINLTRIIEKEEVYLKHYYDSLTINKIIDLSKVNTLCDLGSGAGFPGIVLKILFPNINITLVDSLNKRVNFLNLVIEDLKLENIKAIHERIEDFSIKNPEKYDIVTARAVSKLNTLLELSIRTLKINGFFIGMKGDISREIIDSKNAINKLDLEVIEIMKFKLPIEESERSLIKIKKVKKTSKNYPRRMDQIKKNPL